MESNDERFGRLAESIKTEAFGENSGELRATRVRAAQAGGHPLCESGISLRPRRKLTVMWLNVPLASTPGVVQERGLHPRRPACGELPEIARQVHNECAKH
jgi:hypothetical protein